MAIEYLGIGAFKCGLLFSHCLLLSARFLTKREQKLMQRRQHAEELLEWKRRLDAEEAEIRRIEKQALAAWDKELLKTKTAKKDLGDQRTGPKGNRKREEVMQMKRVKHGTVAYCCLHFLPVLMLWWWWFFSGHA